MSDDTYIRKDMINRKKPITSFMSTSRTAMSLNDDVCAHKTEKQAHSCINLRPFAGATVSTHTGYIGHETLNDVK